jgi:hypothetical protein
VRAAGIEGDEGRSCGGVARGIVGRVSYAAGILAAWPTIA